MTQTFSSQNTQYDLWKQDFTNQPTFMHNSAFFPHLSRSAGQPFVWQLTAGECNPVITDSGWSFSMKKGQSVTSCLASPSQAQPYFETKSNPPNIAEEIYNNFYCLLFSTLLWSFKKQKKIPSTTTTPKTTTTTTETHKCYWLTCNFSSCVWMVNLSPEVSEQTESLSKVSCSQALASEYTSLYWWWSCTFCS